MGGHETIRDAVLNADVSALWALQRCCPSAACPEEINRLFYYNSDISDHPASIIADRDIRREGRLLADPMQVSPDMVFDEDGFIYKRNGEQSHDGNFYRVADPVYVISQDGRVMQVSVDDIPGADLKNALIESTAGLYRSLGESEPEWATICNPFLHSAHLRTGLRACFFAHKRTGSAQSSTRPIPCYNPPTLHLKYAESVNAGLIPIPRTSFNPDIKFPAYFPCKAEGENLRLWKGAGNEFKRRSGHSVVRPGGRKPKHFLMGRRLQLHGL